MHVNTSYAGYTEGYNRIAEWNPKIHNLHNHVMRPVGRASEHSTTRIEHARAGI